MENERTHEGRTPTDRAYDREEKALIGIVILLSITIILLGLAWLLLR